MSTSIQELVLSILTEDPNLSNDDVAELIQAQVPGASTSAASVSSVKSKLKKQGVLPEPSRVGGQVRVREPEIVLPPETQEERGTRIRKRFNTLQRMAERICDGHIPALIVSGPPGLGKSFTVEQTLEERFGEDGRFRVDMDASEVFGDREDEDTPAEYSYDIICGTITPPGLIIALWKMRNGGVVVLDDCDDVFRDETCLNILKAVLDSSDRRLVSYRKQAQWMAEYGIPNTFEFDGSVVFCTNIDFEAAIRKGSSMAPHFEALIDRSLYLHLGMRTQDDFMTRIHQVSIEDGLLEKLGLDELDALEVYAFIDENRDSFYGLSLRLVSQIAQCFKAEPDMWKDDVVATKMRTF